MKSSIKFYFKKSLMGLGALILSLMPLSLFAQEGGDTDSASGMFANMDPLVGTVLLLVALVMVLVLITLVVLINLARMMLVESERLRAKAEGIEYVEPIGLIEGWWLKLKETFITGRLYSEKEERESMLLDHDYDGIQEMDYGMPPWLTYFFLITVGFGVIYLLNVYAFGIIQDQETEYNNEVKMAELAIEEWKSTQANLVDENTVEFSDEASLLAQGKELYMKDCKVCHGEFGEGGVGPNFTDDYWIHGGGIKDIFRTVKYGVPEKGMISWQNQLTPSDMSAVSSYIYTLYGTNPPNPKDPQGEIYTREEGQPAVEEATESVQAEPEATEEEAS